MRHIKQCPKCGNENMKSSGSVHGKPRSYCKYCDGNFTKETIHGYPVSQKLDVFKKHLMGISNPIIHKSRGTPSVVTIRKWNSQIKEKIIEAIGLKNVKSLKDISFKPLNLAIKKNQNRDYQMKIISQFYKKPEITIYINFEKLGNLIAK